MSTTTAQDLLLAIPDELLKRFLQAAGSSSSLPGHCPWQLGNQVQRHGYPGYPGHPSDHGATGFVGWVAGSIGATILTGITTTGRSWTEYWGALHPAGEPVDLWDHCACCREERMRLRNARPVQLSLFEIGGGR